MILILIILCIYFSKKPQKAPVQGSNDPDKVDRLFAEWKAQREADEAEALRQAVALVEEKRQVRISDLEQKLMFAKREEEHWSELFDKYDIELAGEQGALNYIKSNPLLKSQIEKQERIVEKLSKKRYDAETRLIKATQARELCERKIKAA